MPFMVTASFEAPPERQAEGAYVAEQTRLGALEALHISQEQPPTVWAIVKADPLDDEQRQIAEYPFYPFMRFTCTPPQ